MLKKSVLGQLLKRLENTQKGEITIRFGDDAPYHFQGKEEGVSADMHIYDWRAIPMIAAKGDIGLAQAYRDGLWDCQNLTNLFLWGLDNEAVMNDYIHGNMFSRLAVRFLYIFTRNSLRQSRRNIHRHYDLGNDFYRLWLDPSMSYSSAIFDNDQQSLEDAQYNKYDHILRRLERSSGRLLEIGCGWGAFAERALKKHDFDIKGITISKEQHLYASHRLGQKADIAMQDYRKQDGLYDHIISIEMFEAVGEKFWPIYFNKIKSLLKYKGKAVIQMIVIGDDYFERYRKSGDMLRSFIFPGGMLASLSRFLYEVERAELKVNDIYAFGKDYARTLKYWLQAFEAKLPEVRALGFDKAFIRIWRFYLSICMAGFMAQRTNVMQIELKHS